jgi:hypothetical protein
MYVKITAYVCEYSLNGFWLTRRTLSSAMQFESQRRFGGISCEEYAKQETSTEQAASENLTFNGLHVVIWYKKETLHNRWKDLKSYIWLTSFEGIYLYRHHSTNVVI